MPSGATRHAQTEANRIFDACMEARGWRGSNEDTTVAGELGCYPHETARDRIWNIHLDFESMQFICSDCYVERPGLHRGELSSRERDGILACLIAEKVNVDPVCKKPLFGKRQLMLRYNNRTYFFCSERCREIFEARSALYEK